MEDKYFFPQRWLTIVITSPYEVEDEASKIGLLLSSGAADLVHIRKPSWTAAQVAGLLADIPLAYHRRLVLHDHYELQNYFTELKGIQYNSRNAHPDIEPWFNTETVHSLEELSAAKAHDPEYVTLSPIYDSISKRGYTSAFDIGELSPVLRRSPLRVIALGGVRPQNFIELQRAGFSGAALLGYVWNDFWSAIGQLIKYKKLVADFSFQFITNPAEYVVESVAQAQYALKGGCRWIQLRLKNADKQEFMLAAQSVRLYCEDYGATMIIDDDVELAGLPDVGVHLGKEDMSAVDARHILGPDAIIGCTCNTAEDIERVIAQGAADYIGLGPFRYTTTKKKLSPVLGLEGYAKILQDRKLRKLPIVAIGGITLDDLPSLLNTGVDGVAVSGVLTREIEHKDGFSTYLQFQEEVANFAQAISNLINK